MASIVSDNFRILNCKNFIDSVNNSSNSFYVVLGLSNPSDSVGFGRSSTWNENPLEPIDNLYHLSHYKDTMIFGKKVTPGNIRRVIRRIDWSKSTRYEIYRHDYGVLNPSPITNSSRLYDANYYVLNSDYRLYICIDNGSSGSNPNGNTSQDEPTFTDLEPSPAGESGDGYIWKYLFTVSPSDIIKFDSTDYVVLPNNWETSVDSQIESIRENANSDLNFNQIKKIYIEDGGEGYDSSTFLTDVDILGDGTGGKVSITVNDDGTITDATVTSGGSGYTYGVIDLKTSSAPIRFAKLIPIIPPSKGHGYNIYDELGADKVLIYSRFDGSTKDWPIDAKFSQITILKNPEYYSSTTLFSEDQFSSLYSIKVSDNNNINPDTISVGDVIKQKSSESGFAYGYVASYDAETKVLKYYQDRSLYFSGGFGEDETDYVGISTNSKVLSFEATSENIVSTNFTASIDLNFQGITTSLGSSVINLGVMFNNGLANPEINKRSGEIIYVDNRALISRNSRQKEDIKIILEF